MTDPVHDLATGTYEGKTWVVWRDRKYGLLASWSPGYLIDRRDPVQSHITAELKRLGIVNV